MGIATIRRLMGMQDELALLQATNAQVSMLDSGCCGMAGPFGFEKDKYEVSQALGERVLLPAVRSAAPETILVSDGFSCREQIRQNSPRHALHLAEVLAGRVLIGKAMVRGFAPSFSAQVTLPRHAGAGWRTWGTRPGGIRGSVISDTAVTQNGYQCGRCAVPGHELDRNNGGPAVCWKECL